MARRSAWRLAVLAFVSGILVALLAVRVVTGSSAGRTVSPVDPMRVGTAAADPHRVGAVEPTRPSDALASDGEDAVSPPDTEICGLPGLALDPATSLDNDPRFAARIDAANKRFIEALSGNPDERVRAAGLLLERSEDLRLAKRSEAASVSALCGTDEACIRVAVGRGQTAALIQSMTPATDALARAAAATSTPAVYAAAIDACMGDTGSVAVPVPSCQLLSVEQWARLDPDNVDAWLHVAGAAAARKDAAALDDAMNHVAHASGSRLYGDTIAALVDAAVPAGVDDFDASQMHVAAWSLFSGWSLPPLSTAMSYCAEPLLADSNRQQTCDAVAHRLVDNPSSMIERSIGIRLASRLGWPPDTVAALRQEQDALQRAESLGTGTFGDVASCRAIARLRALVVQAGRLGEVGAARAALAASGRSVADLAAEVEVERVSTPTASQPVAASSTSSAGAGR